VLSVAKFSSIVNSQSLRVSPEQFEVVVVPVFGVEDMYNDVEEVEEDPASLIVAGPAETLLALISGRYTDIVGYGAHLPVARTGSDHKIVGGRRYFPQVQNHNIGAMPLCRNPGGSQG